MVPLRRRMRQPVVVIPLQNMDFRELEDEVLIDEPAEEEPAEEIPPMYGPYRFDVNEDDEPDEMFQIIGQSISNILESNDFPTILFTTIFLFSISDDADVNVAVEAAPAPQINARFIDEVAGDGEARCVACLLNKAKVFTLPCSHLCLCHQCLALYRNANQRDDGIWFCPVCRGQSQFVQIPALFH